MACRSFVQQNSYLKSNHIYFDSCFPWKKNEAAPEQQIVFLSHAHIDHLRHLTKKSLSNDTNSIVVCSDLTMKLAILMKPDLQNKKITYKTNTRGSISIQNDTLHYYLTPAMHCPGSTMTFIKFDKCDKRFCYTGDFVFVTPRVQIPSDASFLSNQHLFYDDTFQNRVINKKKIHDLDKRERKQDLSTAKYWQCLDKHSFLNVTGIKKFDIINGSSLGIEVILKKCIEAGFNIAILQNSLPEYRSKQIQVVLQKESKNIFLTDTSKISHLIENESSACIFVCCRRRLQNMYPDMHTNQTLHIWSYTCLISDFCKERERVKYHALRTHALPFEVKRLKNTMSLVSESACEFKT